MTDLHRSASFPFFYSDFLTGTRGMKPTEGWVYWMLCIEAYDKGGFSPEMSVMAAIGGITTPQMIRLWPKLAAKFLPSPHINGYLTSKKIETIRAKQADFARKQSANGSRGGRPPKGSGESHGLTKPNPNESDGLTNNNPNKPNGFLPNPIPSPKAAASNLDTISGARSESAPAYTREGLGGDAGDFAEWLLRRGLELGGEVIPGHLGLDPLRWRMNNLEHAEMLVVTYGVDECKRRAENLLQARLARKIHRPMSTRALYDAWDWTEVKGVRPSAATVDLVRKRTSVEEYMRNSVGEEAS